MAFTRNFLPKTCSFDVYNHIDLHGQTVEFYVPDWATHITVDNDGSIYAFEGEPFPVENGYWRPQLCKQDVLVASFNCEVKNWDTFVWCILFKPKNIAIDFGKLEDVS